MSHDNLPWKPYPHINDSETSSHGYIYALFDHHDNLLYVGQTTGLDSRIRAHYSDKPQVRYAKYIEIPLSELNDVEASLILRHLPPLNKTVPKNTAYYTLEGYQKVDQRFYSNRVAALRLARQFENICGYYHVSDLAEISEQMDEEVTL